MSSEIRGDVGIDRKVLFCSVKVLAADVRELGKVGELFDLKELDERERYDIKIVDGKNSSATFGEIGAEEVRRYTDSNPHSDIYVSDYELRVVEGRCC